MPWAVGCRQVRFSQARIVGTATRHLDSRPGGHDASYVLAPQGDLSATDGWTLDKQATVPSADPFSGAQQSLQFAKGAEAATPAMCVTLDHPTIRFFIRDRGGNEKSQLKVDVLYEDFGAKQAPHDREAAGWKRVGASLSSCRCT